MFGLSAVQISAEQSSEFAPFWALQVSDLLYGLRSAPLDTSAQQQLLLSAVMGGAERWQPLLSAPLLPASAAGSSASDAVVSVKALQRMRDCVLHLTRRIGARTLFAASHSGSESKSKT